MARLVVFSDDWGRHPSSCQYLVRGLAARHPAVWVNTIGMRRPSLAREDLAKAAGRLRVWLGPESDGCAGSSVPQNLTIVTPPMWPSFRRSWQRRLNAALVGRALRPVLSAPRSDSAERIAITTLPIAAAFVGSLAVDRWVYYCVDDFSTWPGLDGGLMLSLERHLMDRVDRVVAASPLLAERASQMGHSAVVLTHGVDLEHWGWGDADGASAALAETKRVARQGASSLPAAWKDLRRPIVLFWGSIDRRLDTSWLRALVDHETGTAGSLVLVGPKQAPDPALERLRGVFLPGALPYETLPRLADAADVLVMPYADLASTRAMQPLKLKEYLATGKPVVVRSLPATREWADAADVVDSAGEFVRLVGERARHGVPAEQVAARLRLRGETWESKVRQFETFLLGGA